MPFASDDREPTPPPNVTAEEAETFEKVSAVLRDGGIFLGNFWMQGGRRLFGDMLRRIWALPVPAG